MTGFASLAQVPNLASPEAVPRHTGSGAMVLDVDQSSSFGPTMPSAYRPPPNGEADLSIRSSLAAVALEIGRLASSATDLQSVLSPVLRRGDVAGEAAQSLDEITQLLCCLADYVGQLTECCSSEWTCNPTALGATLTIQAQKRRLSPHGTDLDTTKVQSGEVEIW